ncbi:MAG: pyruvate kinase [Oscillospiraceae bacterium]|nr:pyruvate kinase [Oscillospiraceae bacterium]
MRKTKIIATLGPANNDPEVLRKMVRAGMDTARINFSHADYEDTRRRVEALRKICGEEGRQVALLADTKGPEIRLGKFEGGRTELTEGSTFTLVSDEILGNAERASVTYAGLPGDVSPGSRILLDDGLIELRVEQCTENTITTTVLNGGSLSNHKGVNVPNARLQMPFISEKDRADLRFAVELEFDFVAASFVRSAEDVILLRRELHRWGGDKIMIIAKIENAEGVQNADAILEEANGLMVARGDLGVEIEYAELPVIQKELIKKACRQGKNVITATQMLESMIHNPRPTRAETSDVANAIYDGTGAVMLSGETATGKYPVEALSAMARIAERAETDIDYRKRFHLSDVRFETSVNNAIAHAAVTTAHDLDATAILTVTMSGNTARLISKFRPLCPIIACTHDKRVQRQLMLAWGVTPLLTKIETEVAELFDFSVTSALDAGKISEGDLIVLAAGLPLDSPVGTNMLKVHEAGRNTSVL